MQTIDLVTTPDFERRFDDYPEPAKSRLSQVRRLVHECVREFDDIGAIEETLKWGEPSFVTKNGSTLRMDWKDRAPEQFAIYFKCTSLLVPTFKRVFGDLFTYENDRAIVFGLDQEMQEPELKQCIAATLCYHKVKKLPDLGILR